MKYLYILLFSLIAWGCKKPDMVVAPPPGTVVVSTIYNYLNNNFEFSLFATAVEKAGWTDSLGSQENFHTVFAITNQGFAGMGIYEPADFDKWTTDSLRKLIKAHLIPGRLLYDEIPRSLDTRYENLNGDDLWMSVFLGGYTSNPQYSLAVNGINVLPTPVLNAPPAAQPSFGISLLNGMLYPMTTAIKSNNRVDIQTYLASRNDMSIFIAGMKKFDLWDRLKNESPITVLAPPDSVFLRYGITADSIGRMDKTRYKSVFMDCYIISLNKIFTSDIFTNLNRENIPEIPTTFPPLLTLPTSDPNLFICMLGNYGPFFFGSFVFDVSDPKIMPNEYGGSYWFYQIVGSEASSYPVIDDPTKGYSVPYIGESKRVSGTLRGAYINHTLSNGVVHLVGGLLLMPEDARR